METDLAPARRMWTGRQIAVLALLLATSVCSYVDRYILPLLQEVIKLELSLSDSALGLATGPAFAMFYALSGVPVARLAERFDRRRLLAAAVGFWSLMTALSGTATSLFTLVAYRFGVGAGEGGGVPTSHSLLSDHFPRHQRGMAMAVLSMGAPIAGILMPLVGGYVAHVWGWRAAFFVLGGAGLILALVILVTLRDPRVEGAAPRPEAANFRTDLRWLFGSPAFVWLFVAGALMGIGQGGFGTFLPSFLMRVHALDLVEAGAVLGIGGVVGVAGTFIGGYLADRFAGARGRSYPLVCALSGATTGACYLGALFQSAWPVAFALLIVASCTSDMKTGPNYAAVQNLVPARMRATAAAVFMIAATLIGSSIGPLLAGIVSDLTASAAFPAAFGDFFRACPGGRAPEGSAAMLVEACRAASAGGLETALKLIALAYLGAAIAFYLCSRHFAPHEDDAA
ncbi:MFS transporter [Sphingomonas gilva]|uniref:MFS transporter n=2 Tax=Sphingomonas gilva TaxID=2305907 RepID=A0A396RYC6_9SPHN|nr:MFS transporter [Sphingomonas gilva]